MASAPDVIAAARECIGTPFIHQARQVGVGLDCAGLIVYILTKLDKNFTDLVGYPRLPYRHMLEKHLDTQPCLMRLPAPIPGAILLMRIVRHPQHLAIWTGESVIHAFSDCGKVVEHRLNDDWRSRITRQYEIL